MAKPGRKPLQLNPGDKFDLLEVVRPLGRDGRGAMLWECRCACGTVKPFRASDLVRGGTGACRRCKRNNGGRPLATPPEDMTKAVGLRRQGVPLKRIAGQLSIPSTRLRYFFRTRDIP